MIHFGDEDLFVFHGQQNLNPIAHMLSFLCATWGIFFYTNIKTMSNWQKSKEFFLKTIEMDEKSNF